MDHAQETEVKLFAPDLDAIAARIVAAGGSLAAPRVLEHNVRYDRPDGGLTASAIVLRLRQDTRARLTYKEPAAIAGGVMTRPEAEVTVDSFETMDFILRRLGFAPYVIYEKYRTTYHLGEAEIVLDELPFGNFIEVEAPTPAAIEATLAALGLGDRPRLLTSYLVLFERVKARLGLDVHDLTFANFAGVVVPPEVFEVNA